MDFLDAAHRIRGRAVNLRDTESQARAGGVTSLKAMLSKRTHTCQNSQNAFLQVAVSIAKANRRSQIEQDYCLEVGV